jgi:signal transduction histidine kinase
MTREVLEFARGEVTIEMMASDVPALLREVAEQTRPVLAREGVRLEVQHGFDGEWSLDHQRTVRALGNLVNNAVSVLDPSGGTIHLRSSRQNGRLRLEVEDNGPGIAAENLARIFAHGFTTRPGGHGFGLHVSANAATEMKASLHARSDGPGTGATFVLQLPLKTNDVALAA